MFRSFLTSAALAEERAFMKVNVTGLRQFKTLFHLFNGDAAQIDGVEDGDVQSHSGI